VPKKNITSYTLRENTLFAGDTHTTASDKNAALAALLVGAWQVLSIVRIERIEIGASKGWRITYRN